MLLACAVLNEYATAQQRSKAERTKPAAEVYCAHQLPNRCERTEVYEDLQSDWDVAPLCSAA